MEFLRKQKAELWEVTEDEVTKDEDKEERFWMGRQNNDPGLSGRNQGESVRERGGERDTIGITEIKRAKLQSLTLTSGTFVELNAGELACTSKNIPSGGEAFLYFSESLRFGLTGRRKINGEVMGVFAGTRRYPGVSVREPVGQRWAPDCCPVMLRALRLKTVLATLLALFAFILARPLHFDIVLQRTSDAEPFVPDEGAVRSERSANISHIIGVSRKIQLIVNKIMFLQISPDGNVNGTDNDNDYKKVLKP
ncbi:hypothetical protein RUM44_013434 [Polyplax serrata]|uniref:Uncharacterized protein n=1 Tax=Polyplax serrata TaxID=468196 RepID=A0ABR1BG36_POLSC